MIHESVLKESKYAAVASALISGLTLCVLQKSWWDCPKLNMVRELVLSLETLLIWWKIVTSDFGGEIQVTLFPSQYNGVTISFKMCSCPTIFGVGITLARYSMHIFTLIK